MGKDYFVVVQTIEAGKPVLTVVPHKWVNGNTLLWPPKQANELRKNAASLPMSSWSKMSCSVKRKYIPTFADAEQEADELSGLSTDASDFAPRRKKKFKKPAFNKEIDLNHLVTGQAQITPVSPPAVPVTSQPVQVTSQPVENIYYEPDLNELLANSQGIALDFPSTVAAQIPTTPTIPVEAMLSEGYVVNVEQPDADRIIKQISDKIEMVAEKVVDEQQRSKCK
ncbi:uncharacterized protein LOC110677976 isoform X3 [Aedes aegypti]|uniref:Uncharacterized protein n=1 Tax=Aedes aegypti TaxID=7159 RepID=A0A6I8TLW5_AEDAE|nr:uncharacterized protein LOC110674048 isoform X2 [Aedes aegypti]XP_021705867.1 uncharacterized protein LOC110677976 isoform X3 [Aedes aegypti]